MEQHGIQSFKRVNFRKFLLVVGIISLVVSFALFISSFLYLETPGYINHNYLKYQNSPEAYSLFIFKSKLMFLLGIIVSFALGFSILNFMTRNIQKNKRMWWPIGFEIVYLFVEINNFHFSPEFKIFYGTGQVYHDYYDLIFPFMFVLFLHLLSFAFWNNRIINYVFGVIFVLLGLFGGVILISATGYFLPMILLPIGISLLILNRPAIRKSME